MRRQCTSGTEFTVADVFRHLNAVQNGASPHHTSIAGQNSFYLTTKLSNNQIFPGESIKGTATLTVNHQSLSLNSIFVDLIFKVYTPDSFLEKTLSRGGTSCKMSLKKSKTFGNSSKETKKQKLFAPNSHDNSFGNQSLEQESIGTNQKNQGIPKSQNELGRALSGSIRQIEHLEQFPVHNEKYVEIKKRFLAFSLQQPRLKAKRSYVFSFEISLEKALVCTLNGEVDPMNEEQFLEKEDRFNGPADEELKIECFLQVVVQKNTMIGFGQQTVERKSDPIQLYFHPQIRNEIPHAVELIYKNLDPPKLGFFESLCGCGSNSDIKVNISKTFLHQSDPNPLRIWIQTGKYDISDFICCAIRFVTSFTSMEKTRRCTAYEKSMEITQKFSLNVFASSLSPFSPTMDSEILSFKTQLVIVFERFQGEDLKIVDYPLELIPDPVRKANDVKHHTIPRFNKFKQKNKEPDTENVFLPFSKFEL